MVTTTTGALAWLEPAAQGLGRAGLEGVEGGHQPGLVGVAMSSRKGRVVSSTESYTASTSQGMVTASSSRSSNGTTRSPSL